MVVLAFEVEPEVMSSNALSVRCSLAPVDVVTDFVVLIRDMNVVTDACAGGPAAAAAAVVVTAASTKLVRRRIWASCGRTAFGRY